MSPWSWVLAPDSILKRKSYEKCNCSF